MPVTVASLMASIGLDATDLQRGLQTARQRLDGFKDVLRDAGGETSTFARGLGLAALAGEKLATVERQMDADARKFMDTWNQVGTTLEKTAAKTDQTAKALRQFGTAATQAGRALTVGLSTPLLALGGLALTSSQEIQVAMNAIRAETGATGDKLTGLGQSFRAVAAQVPQSFGVVGQAVALLAQRTGLTGTALTGLSTQFLTLARVTGGQVNPLITSATKVFQQWGVAVKDQGEALNQFLRTHEATGIGVQELTDKILKFGPALKTAGLSLVESEALLGAFNRQGVVGDKALTALNTTFAKWAKAGVTDAHGALVNLIAAVQKAPTAFAALKVATDAGMGGRGGADFVNAVRSGGVEFDRFLKIIVSGKDTVKRAGDDTLTVANQFDILKKKIELAAEPLGTFIAKQLKDLGRELDAQTPKVKSFFDAFQRQSGEAKQVETRLAGLGIAAGPVALAIGGIARAWAGVRVAAATAEAQGEAFFGMFSSRAAAATALFSTLATAAVIAVFAFFTAYLTNFDGLWDRLKAGWGSLWADFQQLGHASLPEVLADWKRGVDELVDYWHAGIARLQGRPPPGMAPPVTAQGIAASGFAQHLGVLTGPPVLPPTTSGGLGGGDANAAPNLKQETEAHRLLMQALTGEAKAQEILNLLKHGYTMHQAELISRYTVVTAAALAAAAAMHRTVAAIALHTEALDTQAEKIEKTNKANERAAHLARELHARMLQVQQEIAGQAKTAVPVAGTRVEGADAAHQHLVTVAQRDLDAANAKLKQQREEQAKAAAAINRLDQQITAATERESAALKALQGQTKEEVTAQELFNRAMATGNPLLIDHAQNLLAAAAAHAQAAADAAVNLRLQTEYEDALMQVAAAGKATADREKELHGASRQLTAAQNALNAALATGDEFLIELAAGFADAERAQDAFAKSQAASRKLGSDIEAAYTREVERGMQQQEAASGMTHETAVAQELLNRALKSGNDEQVIAAAVVLKMAQAHDAAALAAKATAKATRDAAREAAQFLKRLGNDIGSTFSRLFDDLIQHGFKGFFQRVVQGFSDMFRQIAADYIKSQVRQLIMGLLHPQRAAAPAGGGGGGLWGAIQAGMGLFAATQGGGGLAADTAAAGINDAGALMLPLPTFARGGDFAAGMPFVAGERGAELVVPRGSGSVVPHDRLGGHTTINMTVMAQDVESFRAPHNQQAIFGDLQRRLDRSRRRG